MRPSKGTNESLVAWSAEMAHQVKVLSATLDNLSSVIGNYMQKNRIDSCKCPLISAHEQWHIDPSTYAHVHIQNKNKEMYRREKKRNPCYPPIHLACYLGFWTSDCWSHIRSQSGQQVVNGKGEEASFRRGKMSSSIFSLKTFYS